MTVCHQAQPLRKKTLKNILPSKSDLPNCEDYAGIAFPV
jgi:hypothetical protein